MKKKKKIIKKESHQAKFFFSSVGGDVHNRDLAATSPRENIVTRIRRSCTLFAAFSTPVRRNEVCGTVSQTCQALTASPRKLTELRGFSVFTGNVRLAREKRVHRPIHIQKETPGLVHTLPRNYVTFKQTRTNDQPSLQDEIARRWI